MAHVFNLIVTAACLYLAVRLWRAGSRVRDEVRAIERLLEKQRAQLAEKALLREVERIIVTAHIDATRDRVTALEYVSKHQLRWWEITPAELAREAGVDEAIAASTIRTLHIAREVMRDQGDE